MALEAEIHRFLSALFWPLALSAAAALLYLGIVTDAVRRNRALVALCRRVGELRKAGGDPARLERLASFETTLRRTLRDEGIPSPPPEPKVPPPAGL
jgi:hypothetical protein